MLEGAGASAPTRWRLSGRPMSGNGLRGGSDLHSLGAAAAGVAEDSRRGSALISKAFIILDSEVLTIPGQNSTSPAIGRELRRVSTAAALSRP